MDTNFIPYIIDGALALLVLFALISGWRRGLIASLFSFLGLAASFVAAFLFSKPVSRWVYDRFLAEKIGLLVSEKLPAGLDTALGSGGIAATLSEAKEKLMLVINELLGTLGLSGLSSAPGDQAALDALDYISSSGADPAAAITETVIGPAVLSIVNAAAFLLIFFAVLLVIRLLARAAQGVNQVPVVGGLNQFLGGVFGIAKGLMLAYVAAQALLLLIGLSKGGWDWLNGDIISQTHFASWLASIKLT